MHAEMGQRVTCEKKRWVVAAFPRKPAPFFMMLYEDVEIGLCMKLILIPFPFRSESVSVQCSHVLRDCFEVPCCLHNPLSKSC